MRDLVDELLQAKVKARLFGGDHAVRLGRLVLLERIGSGAMGTVFAAYDPRLDRRVAVKLLRDARDTERVLREARALGKLTHPNVIAVYDAEEADGAVHIVMELAPGVPLRAWIGGAHAWRDVVRVMHDAALGIAAAHRAGLVHRDIKPDNILVGEDRARMVDFGLAGSDGEPGSGTPSYMAPEVLNGDAATFASDQFSFGVTLHEVLHGERPYRGQTREELGIAALEAATARPATTTEVPAWLAAIVRRALAADPAARFPSMTALATELARDRRRRRRALAIAAGALALGGVLGAVGYHARTGAVVDACSGAARVSATWSTAATVRTRTALGPAPWVATAVAGLDDAARGWQTSFRQVCEATRVHGAQSDRLLELRMRCLDRALDRFAALTTALGEPLDAAARVEAAGAIAELPRAAACERLDDAAELTLPADPEVRAAARVAEHQLDRAWAQYALGRYRDARSTLEVLTPTLPDLAPLRAAERALAGSIEARTGSPVRARDHLLAALEAAATARAFDLELDVWTRLLRLELFAGEPRRVIEWAPFADAAARRAGRDGAEAAGVIGEALRVSGDHVGARGRLRAALASGDQLRGDQRAIIEMNLGALELAAGNPTGAHVGFTRAHDTARAVLGEGHPGLAIYLDKLAAAARARGKLRDALVLHDRSLAARRAAFGDGDRAVATSRFHRAQTLLEANRTADARAELATAREIRARAFGPTSPRLGELDAALGDVALAEGNLAEARVLFARAAALDSRLRMHARAHAAGVPLARDAIPTTLEPLTLDRAAELATAVELYVRAGELATARTLATRLATAWRALPYKVDATLSAAVAAALLATGERAGAAGILHAAVETLPDDEASRTRDRLEAILANTR